MNNNYEKTPFWLVWNPEGKLPAIKHNIEESARKEATRLARLNEGQCFYVLAPVCEVKINDVIVTEYCDDLPY